MLGGKLPGVRGGPLWSGYGPPPWDGGFSAMLAWTRDAKIIFYYYHQDQTHEYGDATTWNYTFEPGKWYNITIRIVLNSVGENGGNKDGIMEGFVNGQLVAQNIGVRLRNISTIHVDQIFMCSSYGGDGDIYAPSSNQYLDVDDFIVFNYQDGIDVTKGRNPSPAGSLLNLPFTNIYNENWQKSIKTSALSGNKIRISWSNFSTPGLYTLERRKADETDFIFLKQLNYGSTSYTDETVNPLTGYYYRVVCNGIYSHESYTVTPTLNVPEAPGNLNGSVIGYHEISLTWLDNSSNETGFEIWRKTSAESSFTRVHTTPVNTNSWNDLTVVPGVQYSYMIRSVNSDGPSSYSNTLLLITPNLAPPVAPEMHQNAAVTEKSVAVSWNDNSFNETGFIITRSLAADPSLNQTFMVKANETAYVDTDVQTGTTYFYTVHAINEAGKSPNSNKNVVSTLSIAETKRFKEGLIAYYNFAFNTDYMIYDQSGYDIPLNLKVLDKSAISWNHGNKLEIISTTALLSTVPATKIVKAVKATNEITVECWLKPADKDVMSKSRIFTLARSENEIGMVLDQEKFHEIDIQKIGYSIRMQTETTVPSGYPELVPDRSLESISLVHLTYVHDSLGNESLYINGSLASDGFRPSSLSVWDEDSYLRLGNGNNMDLPWNGSLFTVAIYNKALSKSQVIKNFSAGPCDSLENKGIEYDVNIYPNPVKDVATIEITPVNVSDDFPYTTFRILDIMGKVYYQETLFNPLVKASRMFDFSSYSPGIYVLQVISGNLSKSANIVIP